MGYLRIILLLCFWSSSSAAYEIRVDYRHRPPEMSIKNKAYSGPIVEITRTLASRAGARLKESQRQFKASMTLLQRGYLELLPRTFCTAERLKIIDFLGPIGFQEKKVEFLVRKGNKGSIKTYQDLYKLRVGVKRGTAYFSDFDKDHKIVKVNASDDLALVKMFAKKRFDTMTIIDKKSAEEALKKIDFVDFEYAEFFEPKPIWNFFGIPKSLDKKEELQKVLTNMVVTGEVAKIYKKYNAPPPTYEAKAGLPSCLSLVK